MGLAGGYLYRDTVAQQLVGALVGLIGRNTRDIHRCRQLLHGSFDVGGRVPAFLQAGAQPVDVDAPVVIPLAEVAQVFITQTALGFRGCKEPDDAVLGGALGAGYAGGHHVVPMILHRIVGQES